MRNWIHKIALRGNYDQLYAWIDKKGAARVQRQRRNISFNKSQAEIVKAR